MNRSFGIVWDSYPGRDWRYSLWWNKQSSQCCEFSHLYFNSSPPGWLKVSWEVTNGWVQTVANAALWETVACPLLKRLLVDQVIWTIFIQPPLAPEETDYLEPFQLGFRPAIVLWNHWLYLLRISGGLRIRHWLHPPWCLGGGQYHCSWYSSGPAKESGNWGYCIAMVLFFYSWLFQIDVSVCWGGTWTWDPYFVEKLQLLLLSHYTYIISTWNCSVRSTLLCWW